MWHHLYAVLKWAFQEEEGTWSLQGSKEAWDHLHHYARLAEVHTLTPLLKPNLHFAVCR